MLGSGRMRSTDMRILALDISTTTGWALGESLSDEKPLFGVERLRPKGMKDEDGEPAKMMDQVEASAAQMGRFIRNICFIQSTRPELIVYESAILPFERKPDVDENGRPLRPHKPIRRNMNSMLTPLLALGGLCAIAAPYGIPVERVANQTWMKHYTGSGRHGSREAAKAEALVWGKRLGYLPADCRDTDIGDAVGIWDWAAAYFGRRIPKELTLSSPPGPRHG